MILFIKPRIIYPRTASLSLPIGNNMAASLGPKKGRNNLRQPFCLFHLFNPKLLRKIQGETLKWHKSSEGLTWRQALGLLLLPPWHFPPFLITFSSLFGDKKKKGFAHWDWRRQWWQGLGRAPGFARFKVYCWGRGTRAEEAPPPLLLLLPCLDYGCSRCKCVSEPLTNTNAGIKGQQQQSRHTHTHGHAYTHIHTLSLSLSLSHSLSHSSLCNKTPYTDRITSCDVSWPCWAEMYR